MALYGANLELVQIYLEGESKDEIIRLQLINNHINGTKFNYTPPIEQRSGAWVVWFFADVKNWKSPEDASELEINGARGVE